MNLRQIAVLDNGLRVAVESMPGVASAAFALLLPRGAGHDPEGRCGLSALLVEMLLRGAGARDARALVEAQDALGLDRDADCSNEQIVLSGALLARDLPRALEIYRDITTAPRLDPAELEPARNLCLHSIVAIEDHPAEKLFVEVARRRLPRPFNRPIKGERADLMAVTVEDLRRAADEFGLGGAILTLTGDVRPEEGIALAKRLFGVLPPGAAPAPVEEIAPPALSSHIVKEAGAQVQVGMAGPGLAMDHLDYPKLMILLTILSGGMSGRLFVEVREKRGLVYAVRAFHALLKNRGDLYAYAGTTPERTAETIAVMKGEFERLDAGVEEEEFTRAKTQLRSSIVMSMESSRARAGMMAGDLFRLGRIRDLEEIIDGIARVTRGEMNAFLAARSFAPELVVTLGPEWGTR